MSCDAFRRKSPVPSGGDVYGKPSRFLGRGTLVLVVGPSGVGKDTILGGARTLLAGDERFVFVRREITRPADPGGEAHIAVTQSEFHRRAKSGCYALSWMAHGLCYGIPNNIAEDLSRGRILVVNVSRGVIDAARRHFAPILIVQLTASAELLRTRLASRGRENPVEIEQRVRRANLFRVEGEDVVTLTNEGPVEAAVDAFITALTITAKG